jgi:hypothetical protein
MLEKKPTKCYLSGIQHILNLLAVWRGSSMCVRHQFIVGGFNEITARFDDSQIRLRYRPFEFLHQESQAHSTRDARPATRIRLEGGVGFDIGVWSSFFERLIDKFAAGMCGLAERIRLF